MKDAWDGNAEPETWGGLVAHARECGATLESLPEFKFTDGRVVVVRFLERTRGAEVMRVPIPEGCTPTSRVGTLTWMCACRRLGVSEPKWAVVM